MVRLVSGHESVYKNFYGITLLLNTYFLRGLVNFDCILKQIYPCQAIFELLTLCHYKHRNSSFMKLVNVNGTSMQKGNN